MGIIDSEEYGERADNRDFSPSPEITPSEKAFQMHSDVEVIEPEMSADDYGQSGITVDEIIDVTDADETSLVQASQSILDRKPVPPTLTEASDRSGLLARGRQVIASAASSVTSLKSDSETQLPGFETEDKPADSITEVAFVDDVEVNEDKPEQITIETFVDPMLVQSDGINEVNSTADNYPGSDFRVPNLLSPIRRARERRVARLEAMVEKGRIVRAIDDELIAQSNKSMQEARGQHLELLSELDRIHADETIATEIQKMEQRGSLVYGEELLGLPTIGFINNKVWGQVNWRLVGATNRFDVSEQVRELYGALRDDKTRDLKLEVEVPLAELAIGTPSSLGVLELVDTPDARREGSILESTDSNLRTAFNTDVALTLHEQIEQTVIDATHDVFINPFPEVQTHVEYAFDLATSVKGLTDEERDQLRGARSTIVNMRVLAMKDGKVIPDPNLDGASKLIDGCGDTLENVRPDALDGRASGILIKEPNDPYEGGLPLEFRYAGYTPEEYYDDENVIFSAIAHVEVVASHVKPDIATALVQDKTRRFSHDGRQTPVDPRIKALFDVRAAVESAFPKFKHYAEASQRAVERGIEERRNSMANSGYGSMFGGKDQPGTRPLIELPSELPALLPPPDVSTRNR
jgi:hypothetical protein